MNTQPLRSIVIGTSLTAASDEVVRTGIALARATGASLWLIHAYPPPIDSGAGLEALWIEEQARRLRELVGQQVARTGLSELPGFSPEHVVLLLGSPHREIVWLARRMHAGLIVLGATETPHRFLGSTADRVIRKAPCPVLVVRPEAAFPPRRVEIPVDLSPVSAEALSRGLDLLTRLGASPEDAEALFVLNAFEVGGSIQFTPEQIERFAEEELVRFVAAHLPEGAREPSTAVRIGYPREEILTALEERKVDLAVLGTHGHGGFERFIVGSVAAGVLRGARCNLLVVPPGASPAEAPQEPRADADWSRVSKEVPVAVG